MQWSLKSTLSLHYYLFLELLTATVQSCIIHTRMIVSKYVKITALSDCIIQVFLPCFSDASANICILQSQKSNYHFRPRSM